MKPVVPRGLYAITAQAICVDRALLLAAVQASLEGGAAMIQYRDKLASAAQRRERAQVLLALCRRHGVPLLINDDLELAAAIGADGVHLGASDPPLAAARARLGAQAILGATCGNSMVRVQAAQAGGADYVALGRFFASNTKPDAPQAMPELIDDVRARYSDLPMCAIGGITPHNAAPLITRGVRLVAAVEGVFGAADIMAAATAYQGLFTADSAEHAEKESRGS